MNIDARYWQRVLMESNSRNNAKKMSRRNAFAAKGVEKKSGLEDILLTFLQFRNLNVELANEEEVPEAIRDFSASLLALASQLLCSETVIDSMSDAQLPSSSSAPNVVESLLHKLSKGDPDALPDELKAVLFDLRTISMPTMLRDAVMILDGFQGFHMNMQQWEQKMTLDLTGFDVFAILRHSLGPKLDRTINRSDPPTLDVLCVMCLQCVLCVFLMS